MITFQSKLMSGKFFVNEDVSCLILCGYSADLSTGLFKVYPYLELVGTRHVTHLRPVWDLLILAFRVDLVAVDYWLCVSVCLSVCMSVCLSICATECVSGHCSEHFTTKD